MISGMDSHVDVLRHAARRRSRRSGFYLLLLLTLLLGILAATMVGAWYALSPSPPAFDGARPGSTVRQIQAIIEKGQSVPAIPSIASVRYYDVSRDDARLINASVPFITGANPAATAFRLSLPDVRAARAQDCLAAAAWYEAGNDMVGQEAVVQVVLNRLRHPAFPKSVCAVVFQGAERATGCQFSFTCNGAMARTPSAKAWQQASDVARAALAGSVFAPVGWATHYHADWVVPYWSASVDKVAQIHTHLFFRWRGRAGEPVAFGGRYGGAEPVVPTMARLSPAHDAVRADASAVPPLPTIASPAVADAPIQPVTVAPGLLRGNALVPQAAGADALLLRIRDGTQPGQLALIALDLCRAKGQGRCAVYGVAAGGNAPSIDEDGGLKPGSATPDFYYFQAPARGRERVQWNCNRWPRRDAAQCLPVDFRPSH